MQHHHCFSTKTVGTIQEEKKKHVLSLIYPVFARPLHVQRLENHRICIMQVWVAVHKYPCRDNPAPRDECPIGVLIRNTPTSRGVTNAGMFLICFFRMCQGKEEEKIENFIIP